MPIAAQRGPAHGSYTMGSSMVRYKVLPERADENETLVRAVYEQLAR